MSLLDSIKENIHNYLHGKEIYMHLKITFVDLMIYLYINLILLTDKCNTNNSRNNNHMAKKYKHIIVLPHDHRQ